MMNLADVLLFLEIEPMTRRRSGLLRFLALPIVLLAALAGRGAAPPRPSAEEIAGLVRSLEDERYDVRKAAMKALEQVGERALGPLREAAQHADPDVRLRAFVLIRAIDRSLEPEALVLAGHTDAVVCLDVTRDGKLLVSGGNDSTARVWDLQTGRQVRLLGATVGRVWGVALMPDARHVLVARQSGTLDVHEVATGRKVRALARQAKAIRCIALLPDSKRAVTANYDKFVRLLDVEGMKELKQYAGHTGGQLSLACSADGKVALTGGGQNERVARLWDVESGKQLHALADHGERILGAAFAPDGRTAVTTCWDYRVRLWDVASGKLVRSWSGPRKFFGVAFAPDGRTLAAGDEAGRITLWDAVSGKALRTLDGHSLGVNVLRFSSDGRTLISGGKDRIIRVWKLRK
jgi:WD40 repeat protein